MFPLLMQTPDLETAFTRHAYFYPYDDPGFALSYLGSTLPTP